MISVTFTVDKVDNGYILTIDPLNGEQVVKVSESLITLEAMIGNLIREELG